MSKSSTTTEDELLHNPHAGEILLSGFLESLDVSPRRVNEIVLGKRAVTADTDLRLARYFGMSEGFFLGLQIDHDIRERKRALGDALDKITPRAA